MSHQVMLPPVNDPASEFVVERYYVDVDAPVMAGQAVALVRSERFAWDVPATTSGIVSRLAVEEGSTVAAGAPLIELRDEGRRTKDERPTTNDEQIDVGEQGTEDQLANFGYPLGACEPADLPTPNPQPPTPDTVQRVRATPVARRVAASHDVDLATLSGTGRGNIITRADVLAVLKTRDEGRGVWDEERGVWDEETTIKEVQPSVNLQPSAFSLQPSAFSLPYALTAIEADASAVQTFIEGHERRARRGVTISTAACVAAAAVAALGEHRLLNSAWSDDGIIVRSRVHVLIKQGATWGMQAALVPDAADLNPLGLTRRLAQQNDGEPVDDQHATFAITQRSEPWWSHAQPSGTHTASLTIGDVTQQPRVVETAGGDTIAVRPVVLLVLAYDARVVDQAEADAFLRTVQQRLEHLGRL